MQRRKAVITKVNIVRRGVSSSARLGMSERDTEREIERESERDNQWVRVRSRNEAGSEA